MKRYDFALNLNITVDETDEKGAKLVEVFDKMTPQQIAEKVVQYPTLVVAFQMFNEGGKYSFLNISDDQSQGAEEVRED